MSSKALILPYAGISPRFGSPLAHAGDGAALLGRVTLGKNASIGAYAVLRADGAVVEAGDDFFVGPRSTLHIAHEIFPCIVGDRIAIGENACVHACRLGSDIVVDDGVVILDGAVVEDNVVFEPGATVYPGKKIPGGYVYAGSPAKPVQPLALGEIEARRDAILRNSGKAHTNKVRSRPAPGSQVDASVFIASTASVKGRLNAAPASSIWFSNDFDSGDAAISIGERSNIQDNTIIRCSTAQGFTIGPDSSIGHNVLLHDCEIGHHSLIGIGAVVEKGCVVGDHVLLAAHARTKPGQVLESGYLYAGNPARKLMALDAGRREMIATIVAHYVQYSQDFKAAEMEGVR